MENFASRTAADVLAARALCSLAPPAERILVDTFAAGLLTAPWSRGRLFFSGRLLPRLTYRLTSLISDLIVGYRGSSKLVALRHRFIDEKLQIAYLQGIRQVVILGAGYDSRAHRLAYNDIRFVEVDHPETQTCKQSMLAKQTVRLNGNVVYLPADFRNDWVGELRRSGKIKNEPTFFILEGVSYYLPAESIDNTFRAFDQFAPAGSTLIFDAFPKDIAQPEVADRILRLTHKFGAKHGEPMLWGCDREKIAEYLHSICNSCGTARSTTLAEYVAQLRPRIDVTEFPASRYMYLTELTKVD